MTFSRPASALSARGDLCANCHHFRSQIRSLKATRSKLVHALNAAETRIVKHTRTIDALELAQEQHREELRACVAAFEAEYTTSTRTD